VSRRTPTFRQRPPNSPRRSFTFHLPYATARNPTLPLPPEAAGEGYSAAGFSGRMVKLPWGKPRGLLVIVDVVGPNGLELKRKGPDVQNSIFAANRPATWNRFTPRKLNSVRLSPDASTAHASYQPRLEGPARRTPASASRSPRIFAGPPDVHGLPVGWLRSSLQDPGSGVPKIPPLGRRWLRRRLPSGGIGWWGPSGSDL
jgi:hypothetical protein